MAEAKHASELRSMMPKAGTVRHVHLFEYQHAADWWACVGVSCPMRVTRILGGPGIIVSPQRRFAVVVGL